MGAASLQKVEAMGQTLRLHLGESKFGFPLIATLLEETGERSHRAGVGLVSLSAFHGSSTQMQDWRTLPDILIGNKPLENKNATRFMAAQQPTNPTFHQLRLWAEVCEKEKGAIECLPSNYFS